MATSINKVTLIGNLTRDPQVRNLEGEAGDRVASFGLATNDSWTDKTTGEKREKTEFHNIVIFNQGLVGVVSDHCKKGTKIYVEGALATRKFVDRDGQERPTTEIVLARGRGELMMLDGRGAPSVEEPEAAPASKPAAKPVMPVNEDPSDIPF